MPLPDRARPRLLQPPARRHVARWASAAVWRALHPAARERFVEGEAPPPARRVHYTTPDGWEAPLFRLEPLPDAPGEPVLVAHGAGFSPDLFRYGPGALATALRDAGFAPWLFTHRLDREAVADPATRRLARIEDVVAADLPAALATVAERSGFDRVFVVGHGLGGVVSLASAARRPEHLAGVVALGAPLWFPEPTTQARASLLLSVLLPADLPLRTLARLGLPFVDDPMSLATRTPPERIRGALAYGVDDVGRPWLHALRRWWRDGAPTLYDGLVDVAGSLVDADVPLLVVTGEDDPVCPPAHGERALETWGHPDRVALRAPGSHLDLLLGRDAPTEVLEPVVEWLDTRRRAAWSSRRATG